MGSILDDVLLVEEDVVAAVGLDELDSLVRRLLTGLLFAVVPVFLGFLIASSVALPRISPKVLSWRSSSVHDSSSNPTSQRAFGSASSVSLELIRLWDK